MAYIKSLICEGFKSFKNKTKINFSKGFTSIVGANGSGKSNILDAFVFALGELSGNKLRVNNIKDLICNGGSDGGEISKWARVDIIFDNSDRRIPIDLNNVKISRKINLDGQGKYFLNDKATTRRELQDVMDIAGLVPNSSNLILQGELFRIITMNNNERRELIEGISGIAFYNEKKEKAMKDLEKVEENISRITLLLNELSIQLDSLEKEKNEALKYQEQDLKQRNAEKALVLLKIRNYETQIKKISTKKELLKTEIEDINKLLLEKRENLMHITTELGKVNEEIKNLQSSELKELNLKLNKINTEFTKKETQKENHQKEIPKLKNNLIESFKKKEEIESKRNSIQLNLKNKIEEKKSVKEKLHSLKEELFHSEEQVKEFDSEYGIFQEQLESKKTTIAEKNQVKNEIKSDIRVLTNKLKDKNNIFKNIGKRITNINEEIEKINHVIKTRENEEIGCQENTKNEINIDDLEKTKRNLDNNLRKISSVINEKHGKIISIKSKIKAVQKFSVNKAVEAILSLKDSPGMKNNHDIHGDIYGTIAQLGEANQKYNVALQVAGGNKFNYIVVDSQATAKQCINYLKSNNIGRASFIPLDKIKTYSVNFNLNINEKIIGRAVDLIKFDNLYIKAFEFVFGRSIIVSDIDVASNLQINARKITLDGDVVENSNLMTGGNYKRFKQGGFNAAEGSKIPTLELELSHLKREEDAYIKKIQEIEKNIASNYRNKISSNNEISAIRQKLAVFRDKLLNKKEELKELETEKLSTESEIKKIEEELQKEQLKLKEIDQTLLQLINEENELKSKISLLKENDFTRKIITLRNEIDKFEKDKMRIKLEIAKLKTQLDDILKNREQEIEFNIKSYQKELEKYTIELETLINELKDIKQEISELESTLLEKNQVIGQFYKNKEELLLAQTNIKLEIEGLKSSIHPKSIKINTLEINFQNIESQKNELKKSNMISDEEMDEIKNLLTYSQEKLSNMIHECINIKQKLEPVNMRAIKKFDKIKARYDGFIEKHEIVVEERQSILEFIDEIELEKKITFLTTFNGINDHFKNIFSKLSPEGEAKLELENTEDPFEGGVKMLARPGGKKWCLTQAMSGGEKTLTVVALVLGIQMYTPSPYYILDEIDAAFDDYNAGQVASMIKELSKNSQFILITHRDVTMTKTDQLLGVSNVHGLTTVLNLNIKEALEQIAET